MESDEAPPQAAQRELLEEIGLEAEQLDFATQLEPFETVRHIFNTQFPMSQAPQPLNEIADCRWLKLDALDDRKCLRAERQLFKVVEGA